MGAEFDLERIRPGSQAADVVTVGCPWLVVLSDWSPRHITELNRRIKQVFSDAPTRHGFPTVIVVDDLAARNQDHQQMLAKLVELGGIILPPADAAELASAKSDPRAFALRQFEVGKAAIGSSATGLQTTARLQSAEPLESDGYQEFSKAVNKLSPDDLKQMVEGRRFGDGDDWRYEW